MQILQQLPQCTLLCLCTCILWCLAVCSQSTDVAHANTVIVVVLAVSTHHLLRSSLLNCPVRGNHIMVSASLPAEGAMIAVDVRHPDGTARPICRAMHDNKCNFSHTIPILSHRLHRFHRFNSCNRYVLNLGHLCNLWALNESEQLSRSATSGTRQHQFNDLDYIEHYALPVCFHTRRF